MDPRDIGVVDDTARRVAAAPLWVGIGLAGAALLVVAVVGSTRCCSPSAGPATGSPASPTGRCGCGTACSPRDRCRCRTSGFAGREVSEPLLLRAGRGAQARALSTGLREGGSGAIAPPAPRAEAHRRRRRRPAGRSRRGHPRPAASATRAPRCAAGSPAPCCRPRRWWPAAWLVDDAGRPRVAGPAPGRRVAGRRPLPRPRPRADRPASRHPARRPAPAHRRPAARRA